MRYFMFLQDFWYTTLMGSKEQLQPPLRGDVKTDVLIVGAGAAGLSAALTLMKKGLDVTIIDKNICGGSSTGKSAGFLTPDSELDLSQILRRFGKQGAKDLWECAQWGVDRMVSTIKNNGIECDLLKEDSLFLGIGRSGFKEVNEEIEARKSLNYEVTGYREDNLPSVIAGKGYTAAVRYKDTWGVNALRYAQGVKKLLIENGVHIYESTEAVSINDHTVKTHLGRITANNIIFCADKLTKDLTPHFWNYYYAQTFLSISEPLSSSEVKSMFPEEPFQCWDSHFIYSYWRLTGDNRILLGGGTLWSTYAKNDTWTSGIIDGVIKDFRERWPTVKHVNFRQFWMGRIDMTRDLMPTVVREEKTPWVHYVLGCVGLPWATFCGDFAARHVTSETTPDEAKFYRYFGIDRKFAVPLWAEKIIGKRIGFVLNQAYATYLQVDKKKTVKEKTGEF